MALTDEDKAFLIKIGQELPAEIKNYKTKRDNNRKGRGISYGYLFI